MVEYFRNPWFLLVVICIVTLIVTRYGWRRVFIGRPNIRLIELGRIRVDPATWDMIDHASPEPGLRRIQFMHSDTSVIYTWSKVAETLDVSIRGKAGLMVTWTHRDGTHIISRLTNIGGDEYHFPNVTRPEEVAAERLLRSVREVVQTANRA